MVVTKVWCLEGAARARLCPLVKRAMMHDGHGTKLRNTRWWGCYGSKWHVDKREKPSKSAAEPTPRSFIVRVSPIGRAAARDDEGQPLWPVPTTSTSLVSRAAVPTRTTKLPVRAPDSASMPSLCTAPAIPSASDERHERGVFIPAQAN